eukprot:14597753-Ditylum_brightwellii.AAC.1
MQQWRKLKKKGISKPNPRKQFLTDLTKLLDKLQAKEHEIVLSLDANEDISKRGPFDKFVFENDLVDAYKHVHPSSHPAIYLQGNKQLDYLLVTPGLLPAIRAIGYLLFHTRIFSDHSAIWADFDPENLFLGELSSTINQSARKLKSSNLQHVKNYIDTLVNDITANNIIQRVAQLNEDFNNGGYDLSIFIQKYKSFDQQVTACMLAAEKSC